MAASILLAACGGGPSDAPSGDRPPAPPTPDLSLEANRFEEVSRFGSGRALAVAATDSVSVVATTIGVDVHRGDQAEELATSMPAPLADIAVAADGASALLIGESGAGELWALDPSRLLVSFPSVVAARFADDGGSIDVVGTESVARVSTIDGSTISQSPRAVPGATVAAWFGPDKRALVIAGDPEVGSAEIWTGSEMIAAGVASETLAPVRRAVGDPTGDRVVLGLAGQTRFAGSLVGIDPVTGEQQWSSEIGNDATQPVWDVGHDGRVLALVGMQAQLIGLDGVVETSWELDGVESVVRVMALGDAPGYVIVRSRGSMVFVDGNGAPTAQVPTSRRRLIDPTPVVPGGGLVAADADGRVRQWDSTGEVIVELSEYVAGEINDVAVSPDGSTAAAAASDGNLAMLDLAAPEPIEVMPQRFVHTEGNVDTVAFVPDGTAVVSGISEPNGRDSFDDTLSRWELSTDERSFTVEGIPQPIMGCTEFRNTVRVSPDGEFFVAPFHDFTVSMRDAQDGSVIHKFPKHISIVWGLDISPDGRHLATSSDDWTLRLWDLDDFELARVVDAPPGGFLDILYTPDGGSLIVSDISGRIHLLDVETGTLSPAFDGEKDPPARLSVSPDGRYVAAGARDSGEILIWETSSGRIVQTLAGHAATVNSVEFTPDGRGLASGSTDGTVRLWHLP